MNNIHNKALDSERRNNGDKSSFEREGNPLSWQKSKENTGKNKGSSI